MSVNKHRKSPSGQELPSIVVYDDNGVSYDAYSLQFVGLTYDLDSSGNLVLQGAFTVGENSVDYNREVPLDMQNYPIVRHYDWVDSVWVTSLSGGGEVSVVYGWDPGLSEHYRRTLTIEVDVCNTDGAVNKTDIFVVIVAYTSSFGYEIVDATDGDNRSIGANPTVSITGLCTGRTYNVRFLAGAFSVGVEAGDNDTAVRGRVSASELRETPS